MDINTLRIAVTVTGLVLFLALVAYCWSRRRAQEYHDAALLPFADDLAGDSADDLAHKPVGPGPSVRDHSQGVRP